jgi:Flp pilus assembly protein TadG
MTTRERPNLLNDQNGNVLAITAVGILVAAAIVGSAVDMGQAYRAHNRLQAACDSGVLAGRRTVTVNGYDQPAKKSADAFFNTNFSAAAYGAHDVSFTSSSDDNGNTVVGQARASVDTILMKLFGFKQFDFAVNCSASMGVGNSDVVMVLDTTGSMGYKLPGTSQTRIQALRGAMKNFYTTLAGATSGSNARIRYGFVPYSSSVNVGHLLHDLDPKYLVDEWTVQSRRPVYVSWGAPQPSGGAWYGNWSNWTWGNCPDTGEWTNTGSPSVDVNKNPPEQTQEQRRRLYDCSSYRGSSIYRYRYEYRNVVSTGQIDASGSGTFLQWSYEKIKYDVSDYKAFQPVTTLTANDEYSGEPLSITSVWEGCIEERKTVPSGSISYSALTGISPSGAYDLDLDMEPDPFDDDTKWAPMWPEVAYRAQDKYGRDTLDVTNNGRPASSYCPARSRLLSEMDQETFDDYADSLTPEGSTYLDLGMIWGGRLSSPSGIFKSNVNADPDNGAEVSRHLIFMTDGEMDPNPTIQSAYGIEFFDRRVTDDGSDAQDTSRHTARFLATCQAIKAKGIRVWVIAFTSSLSDDLANCASDSSSFTASDAGELNAAFQEIANQVGELRIVQ